MGIPSTTGNVFFGAAAPQARFAGSADEPDDLKALREAYLKAKAKQESASSGDSAVIGGKVTKTDENGKQATSENPNTDNDRTTKQAETSQKTKSSKAPSEKLSRFERLQNQVSSEENRKQFKFVAVGYGVPLASCAAFMLTPVIGVPVMATVSYLAGKKAAELKKDIDPEKGGIVGETQNIKAWLKDEEANEEDVKNILSRVGGDLVDLPFVKEIMANKMTRPMATNAARKGGKAAIGILKRLKLVNGASPLLSGFAGGALKVIGRMGLVSIAISEAGMEGKGPLGAAYAGVYEFAQIVLVSRFWPGR